MSKFQQLNETMDLEATRVISKMEKLGLKVTNKTLTKGAIFCLCEGAALKSVGFVDNLQNYNLTNAEKNKEIDKFSTTITTQFFLSVDILITMQSGRTIHDFIDDCGVKEAKIITAELVKEIQQLTEYIANFMTD